MTVKHNVMQTLIERVRSDERNEEHPLRPCELRPNQHVVMSVTAVVALQSEVRLELICGCWFRLPVA